MLNKKQGKISNKKTLNELNELLCDINNLATTYDSNPDTTDYYGMRKSLRQKEFDKAEEYSPIIEYDTW